MKFSEIPYKRIEEAQLLAKIEEQITGLKAAKNGAEQIAILSDVDKVFNEVITMRMLAKVRHDSNTKDPYYLKEHEYYDQVLPNIDKAELGILKEVLASPYYEEIEDYFGTQYMVNTKMIVASHSAEIVEEEKELNELSTNYNKLASSLMTTWEGEEIPVMRLYFFQTDKERSVREKAKKQLMECSAQVDEEIGDLFDKMVQLRHQEAEKMGYDSYVELGYAKMFRTDYKPSDVAGFRELVKKYFVPISLELRERRRKRLGLEKLDFYDAGLNFKNGNAKPIVEGEVMLERAKQLYEGLSPDIATFFEQMRTQEMFDLESRADKFWGAGYMMPLVGLALPFIMGNLNGTSHDVDLFIHEMGHAFQFEQSKKVAEKTFQYFFPTKDAAEIHSTSLEYLSWQWHHLFFGEATAKYQFSKLNSVVFFFLNICHMDHFQELIYKNPHWTTDERNAAYRQLELEYFPFTTDEYLQDCAYSKAGKGWKMHGHIINSPFYSIDYALATVCALQFWQKSKADFEGAWADYLRLCQAGGSQSFNELLELGNLRYPFEEEVITDIVALIEEYLDGVDDGEF